MITTKRTSVDAEFIPFEEPPHSPVSLDNHSASISFEEISIEPNLHSTAKVSRFLKSPNFQRPHKPRKKKNQTKIVPQSLFIDNDMKKMFSSAIKALETFTLSFKESLPEKYERNRALTILQELSHSIKDISQKDVSKEVKDLLDTLKAELTPSISEGVQDKAKNIGLLSVVCGSFIYYVQSPTRNRLLLVGISVGFCAMFSTLLTDLSLASHFMSVLARLPPLPGSEIVAQVNETHLDDALTAITTLFATYVSSVSGRNIPGEIFKNFNSIGRIKNTLTDVIRVIFSILEKFTNYIRESYLGKSAIRFLENSSGEIEAFLKECDDIYETHRTGELFVTEENLSRIIHLVQIGKQLIRNVPRDRFTDGTLRIITDEVKKIEALQRHFEASNVHLQGSRQEAVGVLLKGGPGAGKSITMEHIAYAFCASVLPESDLAIFRENPSTFTYNRQSETKYWDGYSPKHLVTYFDDFGQAKDVAGNADNEFMNIIRAINGFEYTLHMAHLDLKGCSTFQSKLVIATTNMVTLSAESIISLGALERRFDLTYIVVPKPEYCTSVTMKEGLFGRKFDPSKLPAKCVNVSYGDTKIKDFSTTTLSPYLQDFYIEKKKADGTLYTVGPYGFDRVMKDVLHRYEVKSSWRACQKADFMATAERFRSFYPDVIKPQSYDSGIMSLDDEMARALLELDESLVRNEPIEICVDLSSYSPQVEKVARFLDQIVRQYRAVDNIAFYDKMERFCLPVYGENPFKVYHRLHCFASLIRDFGSPFVEAITDDSLDRLVSWDAPTRNFEILYGKRRDTCLGVKLKQMKSNVSFYWDSVDVSGILAILKNVANHRYVKWILLGLTSGVFVMILRPIVLSLFGWDLGSESMGHSDKLAKTKSKTLKTHAEVRARLAAQAGQGPNMGLIESFAKSQYVMMVQSAPNGLEYKPLGSVFHLTDRIVLMPFHYLMELQNSVEEQPDRLTCIVRLDRVTSGKLDTTSSVFTTVGDFMSGFIDSDLHESDSCLIRVPNLQIGRDRIKNFCIDEDLNFFKKNIPYYLACYRGEDHTKFVAIGNARANDAQIRIDGVYSYMVRKSYAYRAPTTGGDCGSLFCVNNPQQAVRKIFGIHIAGSASRDEGYANCLTQEMLMKALEGVELCIASDYPEDIKVPQGVSLGDGRFDIIGVVDKTPTRNYRSDIIPSRLHKTFAPALTKPALLRQRDDVDPISNALKKYCFPQVPMPEKLLEESVDDYFSFYTNSSKLQVEKRLLSFKEAILGIPEVPESRGIAPGTSAGYPMNLTGANNLKRNLFSLERDTDEFSHQLDVLIEETTLIEDKYLSRVRPFWLFTDNLKDERRPIAKVASGSTRLFSGCPLLYLIIWKKYFGAFHLHFQMNRIDNGSAVGVNPYSSEWDSIARRLTQYDPSGSSSVGAGDYAAFDGSEKPVIHNLILGFINRWYDDGEENARVRTLLWQEVVNSRHILDGVVTEWSSSLPSGHPATIIINCMYNHIAFRYCWLRLVGDLESFGENVYLIVCGDDNIFSVAPHFRQLFNEMTLCVPMSEIGLSYTTELKGVAETPFRAIEDVEFLKRSFRFDENSNSFIAPLRLDVVLEIPQWTKNNGAKTSIVASNVNEALNELSLHPKDVFDRYCSLIATVFDKLYPDVELPLPLRLSYSRRQKAVRDQEEYFC